MKIVVVTPKSEAKTHVTTQVAVKDPPPITNPVEPLFKRQENVQWGDQKISELSERKSRSIVLC